MPRRNLPLVLTLVAAQLVVMLDSSILNVALPSIAEDLDLTAVGTAWVLNAYFLTFGGLLLISGRAADMVGRRRMFLAGAIVLVSGCFLGGLAPTEGMLVAARLIQGAGAAMLSPAAMSVILARFTGPSRARTMSWWGAASAIGGATGVTVGGLLAGSFGWQSVMFVTGGATAILAVAGAVTLPADSPGSGRHFDTAGAGLLTAAAVAVVFGVLSTPHAGLASVEVLGAITVGGASLIAFVLVERRSTDPVLPLATLREPRVAGGVIVNMLGGAARIGCFVLVALLLQQVLEYDPASAGLAMLPTSLAGFAVSTTLLPRALKRFGPQWVAVAGLLMLVVAHLLLAAVEPGTSYVWHVLPALVLAATGVAFSFTPTTLVIADGMPVRHSGVSSGLATATAQLGGALGIAVYGAADAAARTSALHAGENALGVAHAGISAAHIAAAATAGIAAAIAGLTFPALQGLIIAARPRRLALRAHGAAQITSKAVPPHSRPESGVRDVVEEHLGQQSAGSVQR